MGSDLKNGHLSNHDYLPPQVKLLNFDITSWPKLPQFLAISLAVFFFYIIFGYVQELIFRLPGMQPYGWYLTLIQFIIYSILSYSEMYFINGVDRRIPWKVYFQISFYTVATMGLSNASVGYLNYPTQVIFKCCKLVPVLIGGILIQGKKYGIIDLFAAILMSFGLALFTLADSKVSPNFNPKGYLMISLALVADAIIGNVQEKAMKTYNASNEEVHPVETYGNTLILGTVGYFGVNLVLTLVRISGALVAVTVTTMRKAITIIFSFYLFSKPFTQQYIWAGLIVLLAIYLNIYNKNKQSFDSSYEKILTKLELNLKKYLFKNDEKKILLEV
uniref:Adenosine 3'-phospho 5'-phosphosulfate transporter 2 n=1 Tax=Meloidogyne hapla TaxID=6305 RepID=A0A1I8BDT2_MELHA